MLLSVNVWSFYFPSCCTISCSHELETLTFCHTSRFPINKISLDYESYQDSTRLFVLKSVWQVVGVFSETSLRKRQPTHFTRSVHSNFICWFNFLAKILKLLQDKSNNFKWSWTSRKWNTSHRTLLYPSCKSWNHGGCHIVVVLNTL